MCRTPSLQQLTSGVDKHPSTTPEMTANPSEGTDILSETSCQASSTYCSVKENLVALSEPAKIATVRRSPRLQNKRASTGAVIKPKQLFPPETHDPLLGKPPTPVAEISEQQKMIWNGYLSNVFGITTGLYDDQIQTLDCFDKVNGAFMFSSLCSRDIMKHTCSFIL